MAKLDFINEFGGLMNTTKTYKKEPKTSETMLKEWIKTQKERPCGGEGSWFKDNKVTPKVGVYKLFDNEDSNCGFLITEDQKDYYLNRLEEEFNNGSFVEELEEIRIKHQQMLDKRETNKKSKS